MPVLRICIINEYIKLGGMVMKLLLAAIVSGTAGNYYWTMTFFAQEDCNYAGASFFRKRSFRICSVDSGILMLQSTAQY